MNKTMDASVIPPLNEIIGLPAASSPAELYCASENCFLKVLGRASLGDSDAQHDLVRLRVAYLNWAYAGQATAPRQPS